MQIALTSRKIGGVPRGGVSGSLDLFLCGYLREKDYNEMPDTLQELKLNITKEINSIVPRRDIE